jgi:uncharacterized protein YqgC (DUF456 family)
MAILVPTVLLLLMIASLALVPFGLPGVWLMIVWLSLGLAVGLVGWPVLIVCGIVAGLAEVGEFVLLKKIGDRYGASRRAFWGAIGGGLVGVLIGLPVPFVGSVLAGLVGTFVGGGLVTLLETRSLGDASRVGSGVVLARTLAVALKIGSGVVVLALAGLGFFAR